MTSRKISDTRLEILEARVASDRDVVAAMINHDGPEQGTQEARELIAIRTFLERAHAGVVNLRRKGKTNE